MDKTDRLRDYGLAFLLYEHGLGVCGYELIRELFIFIKLILNSYLIKLLIMKRQFRDLRDDTKMRISQSLKGRSHSETHKQAISDAMKAYWSTIPYREEENNESSNQSDETSM